MEIKFSLKLSKKTVKGFKAHGFDTSAEIKDDLVELLKERLDEVNEAGDDDDEEDDE